MGVGVDAGYVLVVEVLEGNCSLSAAAGQVEDGGGGCEVGIMPGGKFFLDEAFDVVFMGLV